ncbi:MAG: cytochrome c peroxidase [Polyangiaceae bacterium]
MNPRPVTLLLLTALCGCPSEPSPDAAPAKSASAAATGSATASASAAVALPPAPPLPADPPYFPPIPAPEDNPLTPEKVELGSLLFFDKRLGKDDAWSCESCHYLDKGLGDGKTLSPKADGKTNSRHSPTLFNVAYAKEFYWDGRKPTLESQILAAWTGQMGGDTKAVSEKLEKIPGYAARFARAFGGPANEERIVQALASFVRTLRAGNSAWDRFEKGDTTAVGEDAQRGQKLFTGKASCSLCHAPPLYSDYAFHNVGVGFGEGVTEPDLGRGTVTKEPKEEGAFKTPSLRGVSLHPPYFHDGSAATLEAAVDYMLSGGHANEHLDPQLKKVELSEDEKKDLLAFLESLAPAEPPAKKPTLP